MNETLVRRRDMGQKNLFKFNIKLSFYKETLDFLSLNNNFLSEAKL
jgi:hypothetical protein